MKPDFLFNHSCHERSLRVPRATLVFAVMALMMMFASQKARAEGFQYVTSGYFDGNVGQTSIVVNGAPGETSTLSFAGFASPAMFTDTVITLGTFTTSITDSGIQDFSASFNGRQFTLVIDQIFPGLGGGSLSTMMTLTLRFFPRLLVQAPLRVSSL